MNMQSGCVGGSLVAALVIGMLAVPEADARGKGGHSGGHSAGRAPRPPRVSAPRQNFKAAQMPHMTAPARVNNPRSQAMTRDTQARTHGTPARVSNAQVRRNQTQGRAGSAQAGVTKARSGGNPDAAVASRSSVLGTTSPTTTGVINTARNGSKGYFPSTYTYGSGATAHAYRAYGYGRGYRNRYYGSRYGYGRSQGNNRALVSRLRSVHASLTRIDHDYQGHRVGAMHSVSMAIRQLSHRSMVYNNAGFMNGMNNNRQAMRMQQGVGGRGFGAGAGAGNARRGQPMTQAQSDSIMGQDLRTLQGINMQLANQGTSTMGHARASGHVQRAMHELNTALMIR